MKVPTFRRVLLCTLPALLIGLAQDPAGGEPPWQFPHAIHLSESHHLFVYGQEQPRDVVFDFADGILFVNGIQILPRPDTGPVPQPPDSMLSKLYGGIPYVQSLMANGASIGEATRDYGERLEAMVARIGALYMSLKADLDRRVNEVPPDSILYYALAVADSALSQLDPEIVGEMPEAKSRANILSDGIIEFRVPGDRTPNRYSLLPRQPPRPRATQITEDAAKARVSHYALYFADPEKTGVVLISSHGEHSAAGEAAMILLTEINAARSGRVNRTTRLSAGCVSELRTPGLRR